MSEQSRQEAEKHREEAEALREEHEIRRRIGEGGPDQHVPGNTEGGRIEAEAKRETAEALRSNIRKFYLKLAGIIALPLAFIAIIPALIGLYLVDREIDDRTTANRILIANLQEQNRQNNKTRAQLLRGLKRADFSACVQVENLKSQNREKARESYERRFQSYRILTLEPTPELEQLALGNLTRELERNKAIVCTK